MTFGERVKMARQQSGMTREDFADKLQISVAAVISYETNARNPKFEILEKITTLLGCSYDYLFGYDEYSNSFNN